MDADRTDEAIRRFEAVSMDYSDAATMYALAQIEFLADGTGETWAQAYTDSYAIYLKVDDVFYTLVKDLLDNPMEASYLRELAERRGLHAVVEIFSEAELDIARTSGARIIQVNARNLETFATDRRAGLSLAGRRLPGECWIAASAMSRPEHLQDASAAGYQAALIGTALMKAPDPERELRQLLHPGIAT